MGSYITPAYIKPYTKITTWILAMCFLEEDNNEYINDNGITRLVIKDTIDYYSTCRKMAMRIDAFNEPIQYKVHVLDKNPTPKPLELFISNIIKSEMFLKLNGKFNLLDTSGVKLIQQIFNNLAEDVRSTIAVPLQWLVYNPKEKLLTRLCWVNGIDGNIEVYPYTQRSLLLVVDGTIHLDKVNRPDIRVLKNNVKVKESLNDEWRSMVMESALSEAVESIVGVKEVKEQEVKPQVKTESEIGQVE